MSLKSQSAMEYLMTYGWAILIIAIVMIALFQLGLFGGIISPRATAGACQVYRSVAGASLAGQCDNELPQFVAQFGGAPSVINVGSGTNLQPSVFTVTAWIKYAPQRNPCTNNLCGIVDFSGSSVPTVAQYWGSGNPIIYMGLSNYQYFTNSPVNTADGNWHFVAFVESGNSQTSIANSIIYADSQVESVASTVDSGPQSAKTGPVYIGSADGDYYNGYISNVQIYNISLSQSEVTALYQEGIGAAPIDPMHVVGWWPLNGNAQDYSGNNNQGTATAVAYNGSWTSGYVQP